MHDLRRQALESGKTLSRKARSRQSSAPSSRGASAANSRAHSRVASRQASDNEDDNLSDETSWSVNSIDDLLASEDLAAPTDAWIQDLGDRIQLIIDRKRSSGQGREETLAAYNYILMAHYTRDEIAGQVSQLYPAIARSLKGGSEKETLLALKAISLTVITVPSDTIYDDMERPLKNIISDSESPAVKAAAVHTLGTLVSFGGAAEGEIEEVMEFLLEIVESDGENVDAYDAADVVMAAEEEWGFLATQLDDLEPQTHDAMEAFVEQLSSSDTNVAVAAGENIALLYEKAAAPADDESDSEEEDVDDAGDPKAGKRYDVYWKEKELVEQLEHLAKISGRSISKKERKTLHTNFSDILHSVENPSHGPRYNSAIDQESGKRYGSRLAVRLHRTGEMRIDKWWKMHRLHALRRILQGGFIVHYEKNEVVFESLPIMMSR
ncbi:IFRD domain-containing protein [Rhizodiscina lignyota]|uniref:IFRD domain-containing protein n=1 Tax=Rhizodiscina lignyota TaxID=1504668 RepID=A0A9P4M0L4_9PEZI|nr:IFRD domain-containing protein [Rhizodiscina lignyota]